VTLECKIVDSGARRQVIARCDRGSGTGCRTVDSGLIQSLVVGRQWLPVESDPAVAKYLDTLGWLVRPNPLADPERTALMYCSKLCAERHSHDVQRAHQTVSPVNDMPGGRVGSPQKNPPPAGSGGVTKRAPVAPRVSR
jgi:hypothetical protein